ncbi:MAG: cyclic nucleotide-binding domain-containing protein [Ferrovibrio sp.]|jgi:CRP/FNR family transcriptional activator FtrB
MRAVDQELLEKTEIYQRLDPAIVERLVRDCPVREYPKNAILTQQGDASEYVHLILSGRVALMAECCDGETTVVTTMGSGEIFVSPATILQLPYLVTGKTTVPSRVLLIPSARFRQALETEHALALMMVDRLARHWRLLVEHLRELKLHTATERLASYLVRHSPVSSGPASFRLADDRKTIAAELGMSSECLSRTFQQLRGYGIRASGSRIEIAEVRKLRDLYRPVARAASAGRGTTDEIRKREPATLN